ncbi:ABC transporter substrate-binding subunit SaoX [Pelotomaculum propionicicum]|uniref:ABC transporter substrate-binding subunit SaoX n=1 Tax=Pelotomaculum propionicicum TaxID=258475 RepID=UPI003B81B16B
MKKLMRALPLLALSIVLLVVLAGCGGGAKQTTTQNTGSGIPEKDKDYVINLGYYNCDHMTAACIAKDTGIFTELGLNVNVTGNGKVPEAMAAGQMDAGYIGNSGLMRAFLKGSPIMVAASNHIGGSRYLVVSNDIKDPKDLIGKKLAIGTNPEKNDGDWIQWAKELGIPVEGKNYEVFDMADKDEYVALKAGKVDAYAACDPWGSYAEYEKTGQILRAHVELPNGEFGQCCVLSMSNTFIAEHPELARLMITAHSKAIQHIYTKPVRSAEIFADNYKVPLEVALMTIYKKTVDEGRTLNWTINQKNFENQINYEISEKVLDAAPPFNEFVNTKLIEESKVDNFDQFIKEKVDPVFPLGMSYEDWKAKAYELEGKKA